MRQEQSAYYQAELLNDALALKEVNGDKVENLNQENLIEHQNLRTPKRGVQNEES